MKKYSFPLRRVLEYKQNLQRDEKNKLAAMRRSYSEMERQLRELKGKYDEVKAEYLEGCECGIKAGDIIPLQGYMDTLQNRIKEQIKKMRDFQLEIDRQVEVLNLITKDTKTLEKLEEKSLESYRAEQSKAEELFIEEFVSNRSLS